MGVEHGWAAQRNLTAPSGGRVFAMGTMELAWALDDLDPGPPNSRLVAFVNAALRDLTRPAAPAALIIRRRATGQSQSTSGGRHGR
jgi:hypothetical protein